MKRRVRRYRFSKDARQDLLDIRTYLLRESPAAWPSVFAAIDGISQRASRMPGIGHRRADIGNASLRCLTVFSYLIVYDPKADPLMVIRIIHGARNVRAAMRS